MAQQAELKVDDVANQLSALSFSSASKLCCQSTSARSKEGCSKSIALLSPECEFKFEAVSAAEGTFHFTDRQTKERYEYSIKATGGYSDVEVCLMHGKTPSGGFLSHCGLILQQQREWVVMSCSQKSAMRRRRSLLFHQMGVRGVQIVVGCANCLRKRVMNAYGSKTVPAPKLECFKFERSKTALVRFFGGQSLGRCVARKYVQGTSDCRLTMDLLFHLRLEHKTALEISSCDDRRWESTWKKAISSSAQHKALSGRVDRFWRRIADLSRADADADSELDDAKTEPARLSKVLVVILCVAKYSSAQWADLKGAEVDLHKYRALFEQYKYTVVPAANDKTYGKKTTWTQYEMIQFLDAQRKKAIEGAYEAVIVVHRGHGVEGSIVASDGDLVSIADTILFRFADKMDPTSRELSAMKRLFIMDACRERKAVLEAQGNRAARNVTLPDLHNIATLYGTSVGNLTYGDKNDGGLLSQAVMYAFKKNMKRKSPLAFYDLVELMSKKLKSLAQQDPNPNVAKQQKVYFEGDTSDFLHVHFEAEK